MSTNQRTQQKAHREKAAMKKKKRDRKKERTERVGGQCFFFFKCVNTIRLVASVFECLQFGQQNRLLQNMLCIFAVLCITEPSHLDYCMFWSETCESQTDDAIIVMVNRARSVVVWRFAHIGCVVYFMWNQCTKKQYKHVFWSGSKVLKPFNLEKNKLKKREKECSSLRF